jgi:hypothetical protein
MIRWTLPRLEDFIRPHRLPPDRVPAAGVTAGRGRRDLREGRIDQAVATAGSWTMGSSLKRAIVSRLIYRAR